MKDISKNRKTIYTIAIDCGFGTRSTFYRAFRKAYSTTPSKYRKKHDTNSVDLPQTPKGDVKSGMRRICYLK